MGAISSTFPKALYTGVNSADTWILLPLCHVFLYFNLSNEDFNYIQTFKWNLHKKKQKTTCLLLSRFEALLSSLLDDPLEGLQPAVQVESLGSEVRLQLPPLPKVHKLKSLQRP